MYGGDCTVKLIEPTGEYCREIEAYRNAFLECGDSMDGTGDLRQFDDPEDWISYLEKHRDLLTVPKAGFLRRSISMFGKTITRSSE